MTDLQFDGLGAAFYPEQQPPELIPEYIERLAEAGLAFVRMAEFAWDKLEPAEGQYDFNWLDKVISLLDARKIRALLCTPTAVPPVWLATGNEDMYPVLDNGKQLRFGTRRYVCITSPEFRRTSLALVRAMGRHYANDKRIIGWQLDNEVGGPFCFCPRCLNLFRNYCRERFGSISEFNRCLHTHFWGQTLQDFEQIPFPTDYQSPTLWQIYHQFFSKTVIEYYHQQLQELRVCGVTAPISTNMMLTWYGYDHREMIKGMDYACGDYYYSASPFGDFPVGEKEYGNDFAGDAFLSAYLQGLKPETNIRYQEFQCAPEHYTWYQPVPNEIRNRTLTQIALGADHICYFRWDCCLSGAERDAYAILRSPHHPGRNFAEIKALSSELAMMKEDLNGSRPQKSDIALLYSYESQYDFGENTRCPDLEGPSGNGYAMFLCRQFRALANIHCRPEIVFPDGNFSSYKLIIAPALYILSPDMIDRIRDYIRNGGIFLFLPPSGIADEFGTLFPTPPPGPLQDIFGMVVTGSGRYNEIMGKVKLVSCCPELPFQNLNVNRWLDEIAPQNGTQVLATFAGQFHQNIPAMTCHKYGQGKALYLGTWLEREEMTSFYSALLRYLAMENDVPQLPAGVYAAERIKDMCTLTFLINTTACMQKFHWQNREITLTPFDVKCIRTVSDVHEGGIKRN